MTDQYESLNKALNQIDLGNPYALSSIQKQSFLLNFLKELSGFHATHCIGYKNFIDVFSTPISSWNNILDVTPLPVRAFKMHDLVSVPSSDIIKTLTSSGTSGQAVSKIYVDGNTAKRQSKVLAAITKNFIGKERMPMIIVDNSDLIRDRKNLNARAAGILGYSIFGRDHFYCLDQNLKLMVKELEQFLQDHQESPILIFGFTFILWQSLIMALDSNSSFKFHPNSILIHGGGWKKLTESAVTNEIFKEKIKNNLGITNVFNYYGMIEQVGSIFMECEAGFLHCPDYADVIIRDPLNYMPSKNATEGLVQVISILPLSYPGHSLLTEDLGTIHGEDNCSCGRQGKFFSISGRMPLAELRGCSDTRSA
jgi:hypothetical protein